MYKYKDIETTWKDLPDILKNANSNLKIKITDPENVVLGKYKVYGTLGYLVSNYIGNYLFDFTPSDFSTATYIADSTCLFQNCASLSGMCKLPISITNAFSMFYNCPNLTSIDTSGFKNIKNSNLMFAGCAKLTNIDTSAFTNIKDAGSMFEGCTNLANIDTSGFTNVADASAMFIGCTKLTNIDMSGFKNLIYAEYMFSDCKNLSNINTLFGMSLKSLEKYDNIFEGCPKIF